MPETNKIKCTPDKDNTESTQLPPITLDKQKPWRGQNTPSSTFRHDAYCPLFSKLDIKNPFCYQVNRHSNAQKNRQNFGSLPVKLHREHFHKRLG